MFLRMSKMICAAALGALLCACHETRVPDNYGEADRLPDIYPDYVDVTVPVNMAPLHFQLMQEADEVVTRFSAGSEQIVVEGRKVRPDEDEWHTLAAAASDGSIGVELFARQGDRWLRYKPFAIYVSADSSPTRT